MPVYALECAGNKYNDYSSGGPVKFVCRIVTDYKWAVEFTAMFWY
jgi:hypothetical protein